MPKLFMTLIGCVPPGRNTEQHDVFFGIGDTIIDVIPDVIKFWPEAKGKLHFDAWREVTSVNGFKVEVVPHQETAGPAQLFFINLGGYKQDEFEEFHYKMIIAAPNKGDAIAQSKKTAFFRHTGFKGANSHIDDKWGVDVDDIYEIKEILPASLKTKYSLQIKEADNLPEDRIHLGYFKLDTAEKWGKPFMSASIPPQS